MGKPIDDNFWKPKSVDELSTEQGIDRPQAFDSLLGAAAELWSSDEEFEQFLAALGRKSQEPARA